MHETTFAHLHVDARSNHGPWFTVASNHGPTPKLISLTSEVCIFIVISAGLLFIFLQLACKTFQIDLEEIKSNRFKPFPLTKEF